MTIFYRIIADVMYWTAIIFAVIILGATLVDAWRTMRRIKKGGV